MIKNIKNNRRPTKKEEKYQNEAIKIVDFYHNCYNLLRSSCSQTELESIFIFELKNRYTVISNYCDSENIDKMSFDSFSNFLNFENLNESLNIVIDYFSFLDEISIYYLKEKSIDIEHVSIKELLCRTNWKDENLDNLENQINNFYKYQRCDDEKLFFEVYYKGYCINCEEGYELYDEIRKKIKEFIVSDNLKEYKKICKNWYGESYDEGKVKLNHVFLQNRVEFEILSNLKITLEYLKKANLYDYYIGKFRCAYIYNKPKNKVKIRSKEMDLTQYNVPNLLTNLDINFNLPLDTIKSEIEEIYAYMHGESIKDYNLLFENKLFSTTDTSKIFNKSSNSSKALSHFRSKFSDLENNEQKLKVNIEYLVLLLFNFDCQLVFLTQKNIENILEIEFSDSIINQNGEFLSQKRKHYKDILKIIIEQKYLSYSVGIDNTSILSHLYDF